MTACVAGERNERRLVSVIALPTRRVRFGGVIDPSTIAAYGLLVVTVGTYLALDPGTMTLDRVATLLAQRLPLVFVAIGQTIVVMSRGFDLSVAGTVALTNVVVATTMGAGPGGVAWGVATGLGVGLGAGIFNGLFVGYLRLPAIIVTLATWSILAGLALYVLPQPGGFVATGFADFPHQRVGPISVAFIALVTVPGLLWWPISRSRLGYRLLAVGGDERAAYESGVEVARTKVVAFVLCGLFASIGGLFLTMQATSGDPRIGDPFTLNSIAAVALGGALLSGGRASVAASVAGALVIGTLPNVLFLAGVSTYWQFIVAGTVLVLAVTVSEISRRRVDAGAT
jgi:ribose transport system permease protein